MEKAEIVGQFSKEDLETFMKFLSSECEESKGMVTLESLQSIFRRLRRTRAAEPFEKQGRKLMLELKDLLLARDLSISKWFHLVDHGAQGDGKLSRLELSQ